jgi:uncharacterized protein (UPF0332 family)
MNDEVTQTIIEARECLRDSQIMLKEERWKAAVSRAYYAMYHAAKAALVAIGENAFTHQGVNIQFSKHFIKTGIFNKSLIKTFSKMLDTRQKADYEVGFQADLSDAMNAVDEATRFYQENSNYLDIKL